LANLVVENLHVFRGSRHVLRGVSFTLTVGHCLQITGANGIGKTTLLRAICGLCDVEDGRIEWDGVETRQDPARFQRALGYLGHDVSLKGDLTGIENLRFAVGVRMPVSAAQIDAALARVGATPFGDLPLRSLSAGQRRRVALAALTLYGAQLWVLDEPSTNLDVAGQGLVCELIADHLRAGGSVIAAVHHELNLAAGQLVRHELGVAA
jgi:heme exporter protein A